MKNNILLGTLLGDACIGKLYGKQKTYKISWEHSLKQKQYALWKAEKSLNNFSFYERKRFDKRTNKIYSSITIYSRKDDYKYFRELFYNNNSKTVSNKILNKLTPLSIAVWFMDDGSLYYNGNNCHLTISTNCFDKNSVQNIINYFKKTYNINFKKHQKAIRITSVKEVEKFEQHFSNFYHESMNYKKLKNAKQKHRNKRKNSLLR